MEIDKNSLERLSYLLKDNKDLPITLSFIEWDKVIDLASELDLREHQWLVRSINSKVRKEMKEAREALEACPVTLYLEG